MEKHLSECPRCGFEIIGQNYCQNCGWPGQLIEEDDEDAPFWEEPSK